MRRLEPDDLEVGTHVVIFEVKAHEINRSEMRGPDGSIITKVYQTAGVPNGHLYRIAVIDLPFVILSFDFQGKALFLPCDTRTHVLAQPGEEYVKTMRGDYSC